MEDFVGDFVVLFLWFSKAALQSSVFFEKQQTASQSCQTTKISLVNNLLCYHHNHHFLVLLKLPSLQAKAFIGDALPLRHRFTLPASLP